MFSASPELNIHAWTSDSSVRGSHGSEDGVGWAYFSNLCLDIQAAWFLQRLLRNINWGRLCIKRSSSFGFLEIILIGLVRIWNALRFTWNVYSSENNADVVSVWPDFSRPKLKVVYWRGFLKPNS